MASGDTLFIFDALANRPPEVNFASVDLRNGFVVLDFDDATNEAAQFFALLPGLYGGGNLQATITWTTTSAAAGNGRLRLEVTLLAAGTNLDSLPAAHDTDDITVGSPAASGDLVQSNSAAIDAGSSAAGDQLLITLTRLADDIADTLTGDIEILTVEIKEV